MGWEFASGLLFTAVLSGLLLCVANFFSDILRLIQALWEKPWLGLVVVALGCAIVYGLYQATYFIAYPLGDAWSLPPNRFDALFNWILSSLILVLLAVGVWHRKRLQVLWYRLARSLGMT